jgi:hypothetical protein
MFDGTGFLSGQFKQVQLSDILASLPPKDEADKMVHEFFDHDNFPIPTAREPSFNILEPN